MNAELLYTSAPQGLKQGSRGFCTVLSTQGMPINLASKLESLSGYRHVYSSGTPEDSQNPIAYSHLKFSVGGRSVSVLSRVAAYGLDYSQRTNKIAHHVVLDDPMPPSGPAALLLAPGFMRDSWDGQCQTVAAPVIPGINVQPNRCQKWESLTGDAGWGGRIAEAWVDRKGKPTFVIFSIEQSGLLLNLISESISLLPPSKRWQATFGTYITNLPPDVDCKVRCVIAGSEEARMASARGEVIDLSKPNSLGVLPSSEGVRAAREGIVIGTALKETNDAKTLDRPAKDIPKEIDMGSSMGGDERNSGFDFHQDNPFGERHPPRFGSYSSTLPSIPPSHPSRVKLKDTEKQSRLMIVAAMALCLLVVGGVVGVFLLYPPPTVQLTDESPSDAQEENGNIELEGTPKPNPSEPNLAGSTNLEPKDPPKDEPPKGLLQDTGISTSESSYASTKKDIETSDLEIELDGFVLPNAKDQGPPISLKIGIPNATLTAKINLRKIEDKLGNDSDAFSNLRESLKTEGVVKWVWQEYDGSNWRPVNSPTVEQDRPLLTSTLKIDHNCKPGSLIRVVAEFELTTDATKVVISSSSEPRSLDKLHLIQIERNTILSMKPEDLILNLKFGKDFPKNHKIEWRTEGDWMGKITLLELRDRRVPISNEAKKHLDQMIESAEHAKNHVRDINNLRSRLNDFLSEGIQQLKQKFQTREVPSEILQGIRDTLREESIFADISVLSPWNPSDLEVAIEDVENKKTAIGAGQGTVSLERIKDFYDGKFKVSESPSGQPSYKPLNIIENSIVNFGLPVVYEWHWINLNWDKPFRNKSTPKSDYENLLSKYEDWQKAITDIETEFDLDRVDCFRLLIQNDETGLKSPVKSIPCGLWVKILVNDSGGAHDHEVNEAKKDESPNKMPDENFNTPPRKPQ